MSRIALLPEMVASQVAAGEVIERPASVIKELVENSIDAGARKIEVMIRRGGISLIRVVDDGIGMDRDDALLCLERHATSKIRTGADLAAISTLGFRGEALPSIASVSRFCLTTREHGALVGTEVMVSGGKIEYVRDGGDAPGTQIEARSLFYNLPARRKFLRAENTEASHCEHQLHLQSIGHPQVGFVFVQDDRVVYQLPATTNLLDRIRDLCGVQLAGQMLEVPEETLGGITFRGFIGKPGVSRSTRAQQLVFINGRAVENNVINFALREGYHTALMKGQYPVTFLFIEMDPAAVDVNVHPAKREVRFRDHASVREAVVEVARRALESGRGVWTKTFAPPPASDSRDEKGSARFQRAASGFQPDASATPTHYSKRNLPHYERPHGIYHVTFSTRNRRILSPEARTVVLDAVRYFDQKRYELFAACVMPDHVHALLQPWVKEEDSHGNPVFWPLGELLHSIKSFTANEINKLDGKRDEVVWEKESYDRLMRGDTDVEEKFSYICRNPWTENIVGAEEDYPWVWTWNDRVDTEGARQDAAHGTLEACAPLSPSELIPPREQVALRRDWAALPLQPSSATSDERTTLNPQMSSPSQPPRSGDFRILGVLGKLYVLMENASGLVLVDQHAAHERILFEELRRRMEAQGVPAQRLLMPLTIQLSPRDADWISQNLGTLQKMGIGIEPFGAGTFKVDALPQFLRAGSDPLQLLRDIIDELRETSAHSSRLRLGEDVIATTVCRHAVKANDYLREPELVRLIQDLLRCELPYCCPHGRPTMIQISYAELEKKFGRKV